MPTFYPSIPDDLRDWALAQPLFFTATAPTYGAHVNVSPKGHTGSSLAILSPNRVAYLDATGSGCETAAHVRENGRITLMWLSFGATPRIVRFFCRGRIVERGGTGPHGSPAFEAAVQSMRAASPGGKLAPLPARHGKAEHGEPGQGSWRSVVLLDVWKVQTSCGWGVPLMTGLKASEDAAREPKKEVAAVDEDAKPGSVDDIRASVRKAVDEEKAARVRTGLVYKGPAYEPRVTMANFMAVISNKGGKPGADYQALNNASSLDGLPGYQSARRTRHCQGNFQDRLKTKGTMLNRRAKVVAARFRGQVDGIVIGLLIGVVLGLAAGMGWDAFVECVEVWVGVGKASMAQRLTR